jgi:hypothetical protein
MHNLGHMRFENLAQAAGVNGPERGFAAAMGADWADYDRDGNLDLVITDWHGSGAVLYRGLGSMQYMTRSSLSGLTRMTCNRMGFGAKWADFDNDGWVDVFLVNGHVYDNSAEIDGPDSPFRQRINLLYNDHGLRFKELLDGVEEKIQRTLLGRGSATVDYNNDGRIDLLAVDFEGPVMLLENRSTAKNHWLKLNLRSNKPNRFAYGAHLIGRAGDKIWTADVSPASSYLSSSDPRIHWGLGDLETLDSLTIRWPQGNMQTLKQVRADQILTIVEE